jgi:Tol biopolymer transport system component
MGKRISLILFFTLFLSACKEASESKQIAYLSGEKWNGGRIYLIKINGGNPRQLNTGLVDDGCPIWSPDGNKLLFVSANGSNDGVHRKLNLFSINIDGSGLTQLTDDLRDVYSASWSMDGKQIIYAASQNGEGQPVLLYLLDVGSKKIKQVTFPQFAISYMDPSWSPDGRSIIFSANSKNEQQNENNPIYSLFRLSLDDYSITQISKEDANQLRNEVGADYSPDGKQIAFYSGPSSFMGDSWSGKSNRITIIMENGEQREFAQDQDKISDIQPKWSTDGKQIAFSSNRDHLKNALQGYEIYIMNSDGSNVRKLTSTGKNYCPDWQP